MRNKQPDDEPTTCQHCGALVFADTRRCHQCGRFPVKLHRCPRCHIIAPADAKACPRCGRPYDPDGDYL